MPSMPFWLAKTTEMVAMDRWFSLVDAGSETALAERYEDAIARIVSGAPDLFTGNASATSMLGAARAAEAMQHLGTDWLNFANPNSGGDFWPQIPTWQIVIWLRQGILSAAKKALGVNRLPASEVATVYHAEIETDPDDPRDTVLPLTTIWVCTGNHSSNGFEVDAVRGPTCVELVIATPPPRLRSRLWSNVGGQLDAFWLRLHGDVELPPPPDREEPPPADA